MNKKIIISIIIASLLVPGLGGGGLSAAGVIPGSIYLQVEENGEAWYVQPTSRERFYLGRPDDAWNLLRGAGLGISNENLKKIPLGVLDSGAADADADGLGDYLEDALGTNRLLKDSDRDGFDDRAEILSAFNPLGSGTMPISLDFTRRYSGYIFLQAEAHGEAWYVNPSDGQRYYLGRKEDAFAIMRQLGIGISNSELSRIRISQTSRVPVPGIGTVAGDETANGVDLRQLEFLAMELVNHERLKAGLKAVSWNSDLASVAREHSENLAAENKEFTGYAKACDFPLIHHEGLEFGPYNSDRLQARGIHYYAKTGENIALVSAGDIAVVFAEDSPAQIELSDCPAVREDRDNVYENRLNAAESTAKKLAVVADELDARQDLYEGYSVVEVAETAWHSATAVAADAAAGWMNSPGHRENILKADYDEAGIGAAYVNGYMIITQVFIQRAECGYQGGVCCEESGYLPYCYLPLSCSRNICGE